MTIMISPDLWPALIALGQVLAIDLVLAGDNAVVVGLAVAGLAPEHKKLAIGLGVAFAAIIRIALALIALDLLAVVGLTLAGGLLLLWVCWRMYRELRHTAAHAAAGVPARKTLRAAIVQIVLADLSMSLDNVLAVAGAAHDHPWVLVFGLAVSVLLMGLAANAIARLLDRYRWIAWIGLLIVLYVALKLIWEGSDSVIEHTGCAFLPSWAPVPLHHACDALARPGTLAF